MAETGWPVPLAIAANTDATAQQIFAIANTELEALSERLNWPHLEVEYDFATVPAQTVYFWPDDFRVLAQQSIYNAVQYYGVRGSLPVPEWNMRRNALLGQLDRQAFRVSYPLGAPAITIDPAPVAAEACVATYYSKLYAVQNDGTPIALYMQDTDISRIPERLVELGVKWRFRLAKGLDYSAALAEYNSTVEMQYAKYSSLTEIPVGGLRRYDSWPLTEGFVPFTGFGPS